MSLAAVLTRSEGAKILWIRQLYRQTQSKGAHIAVSEVPENTRQRQCLITRPENRDIAAVQAQAGRKHPSHDSNPRPAGVCRKVAMPASNFPTMCGR